MENKIRKFLKNVVAKEILSFFHQNQTSFDSVGGISAWVNEDREEVKKVLEKMVSIGILEEDSTGRTSGYCYTRDDEIMRIINKIMNK